MPAEIISALIGLVAIWVSVVSLIRTRRVQARQLEFEAITAALAKKQLVILERQERLQDQAFVTAELVKIGKTDFRFVVMNQGAATASGVTFEVEPDTPLLANECARKLPYPTLQSGQSFTLIAALSLGSALSFNARLRWKNPDGSQGINEIHLSV